jgi:hypothetical protein
MNHFASTHGQQLCWPWLLMMRAESGVFAFSI